MARYRGEAGRSRTLREKREELSVLRADHAKSRLVLQQITDEISDFETFYDQALGRRVAELDRLEAEIHALQQGECKETAANEHECQGAAWRAEALDIKSLYREVAKAVHPDIGGAGPGDVERNELMSRANRAYAEADCGTLQDILETWYETRGDWDPEWEEAERLDILIARERQALTAVNARAEELRESFALGLKRRMDQGAVGCDLLSDMMAAVDIKIARARARLSALKKEGGEGEAAAKEPEKAEETGTRTVFFPRRCACATVYLRDRNSSDFSKWKRLGSPDGAINIPAGKELRLDVTWQPGIELSWLRRLQGDDIQSLFLYGISDTEIGYMLHLEGLEELYLSGEALTDAALAAISTMTNLKRIYIYQTAVSDSGLHYLQRLPRLAGLTSSGNGITEAGLAGFQKAIPRVKTVSFQWRR